MFSQFKKHPRAAWWITMALIVAVAAVLRLWDLSTRPGFEWDETVYANIGGNLVTTGDITLKTEFGKTTEPYLFHPPFYFLLLAAWMKAFGVSIIAARYLAVIGSLFMIILTGLLLRRLIGGWSLVGAALIAVDGWMVFENRIGWLDNTLMLIIVGGMLCYVKAFQTGRTKWFVIAGLVLGFAGAFKVIGLYVLLAVALHWIITRSFHRKHLAFFGTAIGVLVIYVIGVSIWSFRDGKAYFWIDSAKQFNRAIGVTSSRGVVTPGNALPPLLDHYSLFAGTLLVTIVAGVVLIIRTVQMIKNRSTVPVGNHLVLYCWGIVSIVAFGTLGLKFPNYFILVLVPLILFLVAELQGVAIDLRKQGATALSVVLVVTLTLIGVADLGAFTQRIVVRTDNALGQTATYARTQIPRDAIVVTEETVGAIIPQDYCSLPRANACETTATYLITYTSSTQKVLNTPTVKQMLASGVKVAKFTGFKETITVYKVTPAP